MSFENATTQLLHQIRVSLTDLDSPDLVLQHIAKEIMRVLQADLIYINYAAANGDVLAYSSRPNQQKTLLNIVNNEFLFHNMHVEVPSFCKVLQGSNLPVEFVALEMQYGTRSLGIVPIYHKNRLAGWIECRFFKKHCTWSKNERLFLEQMSEFCALFCEEKYKNLEGYRTTEEISQDASTSSWKVLDAVRNTGDLLMIRTDQNWNITNVYGDAEATFGVSSLFLLNNSEVWDSFIDPSDLRTIKRAFGRMKTPQKLNCEIKILNQQTNNISCAAVTIIPLYNNEKELVGWEILGFDITERYNAEKKSYLQRKNVEALYNISLSVQAQSDPEQIANSSLKTIISTLGAAAGYIALHNNNLNSVELLTTHGLSQKYLSESSRYLNSDSLVKKTVTENRGLYIKDINNTTHRDISLAAMDGLRSAVVIPLSFVNKKNKAPFVLGALIIFHKKEDAFSNFNLKFISAAASQTAIAIHKAESVLAEKRQIKMIATLYRVARALSELTTIRQIAKYSFSLLKEELNCKRVWLGILDESGTTLTGQGGIGEGLKEKLLNLSINLEHSNNSILNQIINNKSSTILNSAADIKHLGLLRIFKRLQIDSLLLVPLIFGGKVIGIFAIEPDLPINTFTRLNMALLQSIVAEVANAILASQLKNRRAESKKMRSIGLLASGVAHNFNNLLQAVMGQAALIEMQSSEDSPVGKAAKDISKATERAAGLIRQMMILTQQVSIDVKNLSVLALINDSLKFFTSIHNLNIKVESQQALDYLQIEADYGQMQQVILSLITNAYEAVRGKQNPLVKIKLRVLDLKDGEVDPAIKVGKYICISVIDNGKGMDQETLSRCFEPFFTTKDIDLNTGLGVRPTGLGLALAYSIVRQHQGVLTVKSTKGLGTVLSIFLPVKKMTMAALDEATHAQQIFVLDQKGNIKRRISSLLEGNDLEIVHFTQIEDLLNQMSSVAVPKILLINIEDVGERIVSFVKQLRSSYPDILLFGVSKEPEKWSGLLRYVADMRVFRVPLDDWAIDALKNHIFELNDVQGKSDKPENVLIAHGKTVKKIGDARRRLKARRPLSERIKCNG
ncbi:MAG: GAF domain-containing protein [Bdellovibrionota bacterium]|jgi:signal transduction histidine kinase